MPRPCSRHCSNSPEILTVIRLTGRGGPSAVLHIAGGASPEIEGFFKSRGRGARERIMPTILIVDDEELILSVLREYLEEIGFLVIVARNGRVGMHALGAFEVDLMLVDLNMPVMDGSELIRQAREEGYQGPIILISATPERLGSDVRAEVFECIGKPFSPETLNKAINLALNRRYPRRAIS
jgi:CheY-like chemotaxis protein